MARGKLDVWALCRILRKNTDFLRRVIAPVGGTGGVTLSQVCPHCNSFLRRTMFGAYRRDTETATRERRSTAVGGVRCVEAHTNGERPTGYWWCSSVPMPMKQRCSNALKLLANKQTDGDSPIQSIVAGLRERSRKESWTGLEVSSKSTTTWQWT